MQTEYIRKDVLEEQFTCEQKLLLEKIIKYFKPDILPDDKHMQNQLIGVKVTSWELKKNYQLIHGVLPKVYMIQQL